MQAASVHCTRAWGPLGAHCDSAHEQASQTCHHSTPRADCTAAGVQARKGCQAEHRVTRQGCDTQWRTWHHRNHAPPQLAAAMTTAGGLIMAEALETCLDARVQIHEECRAAAARVPQVCGGAGNHEAAPCKKASRESNRLCRGQHDRDKCRAAYHVARSRYRFLVQRVGATAKRTAAKVRHTVRALGAGAPLAQQAGHHAGHQAMLETAVGEVQRRWRAKAQAKVHAAAAAAADQARQGHLSVDEAKVAVRRAAKAARQRVSAMAWQAELRAGATVLAEEMEEQV